MSPYIRFWSIPGKEVKMPWFHWRKGATSIILDLQKQAAFAKAVAVCNIFLPKKTRGCTRGKIKKQFSYETTFAPVDLKCPWLFWWIGAVHRQVKLPAGTLQDYDRAVIMGEKSYGKGLVQLSRPLSYNSQVKITTAKYYTPSGRCILVLDYSRRRPDNSVVSVPDSLKKPFKTTNGRLVYDGGGIDPDVALARWTQKLFSVLHYNGFLWLCHAVLPQAPTVAASGQFDIPIRVSSLLNWVKQKVAIWFDETHEPVGRTIERGKCV